MLRRLIGDTAGATAIEYAVIASLISIAAIGVFQVLGERTLEKFSTVETAFRDAR